MAIMEGSNKIAETSLLRTINIYWPGTGHMARKHIKAVASAAAVAIKFAGILICFKVEKITEKILLHDNKQRVEYVLAFN